jgi:hypothetical protein
LRTIFNLVRKIVILIMSAWFGCQAVRGMQNNFKKIGLTVCLDALVRIRDSGNRTIFLISSAPGAEQS